MASLGAVATADRRSLVRLARVSLASAAVYNVVQSYEPLLQDVQRYDVLFA